jgi:hypothetical protein
VRFGGETGSSRKAHRRFLVDPQHPSLRFKRGSYPRADLVGAHRLNYRAPGVLAGDEIVWFRIGSHADYEKLLA